MISSCHGSKIELTKSSHLYIFRKQERRPNLPKICYASLTSPATCYGEYNALGSIMQSIWTEGIPFVCLSPFHLNYQWLIRFYGSVWSLTSSRSSSLGDTKPTLSLSSRLSPGAPRQMDPTEPLHVEWVPTKEVIDDLGDPANHLLANGWPGGSSSVFFGPFVCSPQPDILWCAELVEVEIDVDYAHRLVLLLLPSSPVTHHRVVLAMDHWYCGI